MEIGMNRATMIIAAAAMLLAALVWSRQPIDAKSVQTDYAISAQQDGVWVLEKNTGEVWFCRAVGSLGEGPICSKKPWTPR